MPSTGSTWFHGTTKRTVPTRARSHPRDLVVAQRALLDDDAVEGVVRLGGGDGENGADADAAPRTDLLPISSRALPCPLKQRAPAFDAGAAPGYGLKRSAQACIFVVSG